LEAILPRNAEACPETHAAVAEALGYDKKADQCPTAFSRLIDRTGIDRLPSDTGIQPELLASVMRSPENLPMIQNNACPISETEILELARQILIDSIKR
jgi:alcohol dehydrogenase class IV